MSNRPHYLAGRPWGTCDRCAEVRRRDTLRREWSGLVVCGDCFDPRPPDMNPPRLAPEGLPIRDPRPEPDPVFVEPGDVTEADL